MPHAAMTTQRNGLALVRARPFLVGSGAMDDERTRGRCRFFVGLLLFVLSLHTTLAHLSAPLLPTLFALLSQLLKLRALFGRQDGEQFILHARGGRLKFGAERLYARLLFGRQRCAVASRVEKLAHLLSPCAELFGVAFSGGAKLLSLRVGQIKFPHETTEAVTASAASLAVPATHTTLTAFHIVMSGSGVVLRGRRRLLREDAGSGQTGDESERQTGSG